MGETASEIVAYGLAATASPLSLLVTLVILTSGRGRANGIALLGGFLGALAAVCAVALLLAGLVTGEGREGTIASLLKLALGLLFLVAAWHERPGGEPREAGGGKAKALLARLEGVTPRAALLTGLFIGGVSPRRLAITVLAAATIAVAGLATGEEIVLAAVYVLIASLIVAIPVLVYVVAGRRSESWMNALRTWVIGNAQAVVLTISTVFGLLFTTQAVAELLG